MGELIQPFQAKPTAAVSELRLYPNIYGRYEQVGSADVRQSLVSPFTVNVKDFGALGDDSTDDNAAIALAITYGDSKYSTYGWTLFFPTGVYRTSAAIAFATKNNITIRGEGRGASKIRNTDANTTSDILTFGASSQITMRDFSIWSNVSRTAGSAIALAGTSSVIIDSMFIWNCYIGINMTSTCQLTTTTNVTFNGPNNDSYGFIVNTNGYGDHIISNCVISQVNSGHLGTGIYLQGCLYISVTSTDIVGWKNGMQINPASSQDVTWSFFNHVLFDSSGERGAIITSGGSTQKVKGVYFTNCWWASSGVTGGGSGLGDGLLVSISAGGILDDIKVVGSRSINNKNHGILLNGGTNININCSSIWGNGVTTANTYDGVLVKANTTDFGIQDCLIGGASTSPFVNQQKYAIEIEAGTSDRYTILGNDVTGNTTANNTGGILDGGTGLEKIIDYNIGSVTTGGLSSKGTTTSITTAGGEALIIATQTIAPRDWKVGTHIRFKARGICTGVAGTAIFRIRSGTAGTTSDAAIFTGPTLTTAVGSAIEWNTEINFWVSAIGSSGTIIGDQIVINDGTTGIANVALTAKKGTFATFNTTTAVKIQATLVLTAASNAATVEGATFEIVKL